MANTSVSNEVISAVRASFNRATAHNRNFFPDFYETLLSKNEAFRAMFGDVNMVHQYARLYAGLEKLFSYAAEPTPAALGLIAEVHSRSHLSVQPADYIHWVDALLHTLKNSDPDFDADLARRWVDVIKPGIKYMQEKY